MKSLSENFVLSELKLEIFVYKSKGWWDASPTSQEVFSSNSLFSMF
jgi:hypothetical protein